MTDTFQSLIDRGANEYPDQVFLIDSDSDLRMRYLELQANCIRFGNFLNAMQVPQGANIGFLMDNGYWTATVMLGTLYNGFVTVPLNAVASRRNLGFAIENAQVDLIIVGSTYRSLLDKILSEIDRSVPSIEVDMEQGFAFDFAQFSSEPTGLQAITGDSPGMILHTSGTVGMPKGALLSHNNLIAGGNNVVRAQHLTAADIAFCILPLYHINGQVVTVVAPLVSGSTVVMPRKFSLSKFWPVLTQHKCTWFSTVPTITKYLLDDLHARGKEQELRASTCLKFARSASSAMPANMLVDFEKTFGIPMLESMGLTECAAPLLANPMPPAIRKPGSVGIAFGNEVTIIDANEQEVDTNAVGEIVLRGDNVIREYYNAPEATASAFTADGWFRTGDLGYRDADGYFFVTGRIKELIIKGGENISPREIDDALYRYEAIKEVASFGFPDETYGQVIAVAVVVKDGRTCTEEELLSYCKAELGAFRSPSLVFFVDDLPKGPSGKIQRLQVAESLIPDS